MRNGGSYPKVYISLESSNQVVDCYEVYDTSLSFNSFIMGYDNAIDFELSGQIRMSSKTSAISRSALEPREVIFNNPATIVYWKDGTKTVVKAYDERFDKEKGLAMAYLKKLHGNKGNYNDVFRKWL